MTLPRLTIIALLFLMTNVNGHTASLEWDDAASRQLNERIEAGDYGTMTSILISRDGKPVHEGYYNDTDATTLHNTRSVTKTMTGMAVAIAIADGDLTLDSKVAPFFPELMPFANPDPRKQDITVKDLLTMSGPLECDDWNNVSRGNEERMYIVEDWSRFYWDLPMAGYPSWKTPPSKSAYGRVFSYCTAGVQILGEVVERATGTTTTDLIEQRLFAPMAISEFKWPRTGTGVAHLGGGLELTTRSLAKFAELQRNDGAHGKQQLYPKAWAKASSEVSIDILESPGFLYGYLWWLMPYEVDGKSYYAVGMNGNGGNRVVVLPDFDVTIVQTNVDYNTREMHQNAGKFFQTEVVARLSSSD
ncbi:MAG: serine hydrolase domain-containing protein [Woeseiaceae bacterium]